MLASPSSPACGSPTSKRRGRVADGESRAVHLRRRSGKIERVAPGGARPALPNTTRSVVYATVASKAACATPHGDGGRPQPRASAHGESAAGRQRPSPDRTHGRSTTSDTPPDAWNASAVVAFAAAGASRRASASPSMTQTQCSGGHDGAHSIRGDATGLLVDDDERARSGTGDAGRGDVACTTASSGHAARAPADGPGWSAAGSPPASPVASVSRRTAFARHPSGRRRARSGRSSVREREAVEHRQDVVRPPSGGFVLAHARRELPVGEARRRFAAAPRARAQGEEVAASDHAVLARERVDLVRRPGRATSRRSRRCRRRGRGSARSSRAASRGTAAASSGRRPRRRSGWSMRWIAPRSWRCASSTSSGRSRTRDTGTFASRSRVNASSRRERERPLGDDAVELLDVAEPAAGCRRSARRPRTRDGPAPCRSRASAARSR